VPTITCATGPTGSPRPASRLRAGAARPRRGQGGTWLHAGRYRQGPRLPHEAERWAGDARCRGRRRIPRRRKARHRRRLLRRHRGLVGRHAHDEVRCRRLLVWRRHRGDQGRAAELPGTDAFRREGRLDPDVGCRGGADGAAQGRELRLYGRRARVRLRRAGQLQLCRTMRWRNSARWTSSPGTWASPPPAARSAVAPPSVDPPAVAPPGFASPGFAPPGFALPGFA